MKTTIQLLLILLLTILNLNLLKAQETIPISGGDIFGSGGSVSYTVGQVAFSYLGGVNGTVLQGIQQPFEIYLVTGIEKAKEISLDCIVYPNPVKEQLQLKIHGIIWENLHWVIYNLSGKLLKEDQVSQSLSSIPLNDFAEGAYLFSIFDQKNNRIKTFQIIKN